MRPARAADAPELAALSGALNNPRWSNEYLALEHRVNALREILQAAGPPGVGLTWLVATEPGKSKAVGFSVGSIDAQIGIRVCEVSVEEAHRRAGIGRTLLLALLGALAGEHLPAELEVTEDNVPARRLYESLGFTASRSTALPNGAPALVMRRPPAPLRGA